VGSHSTQPLKIGILCHPTYGGSGIVATELGLALAERGHHIHFVSHALPFRLPEGHPNTFFHEVGVTTYPLFKYPPYSHVLSGTLVDLCRREMLDVIHAHYAIPHALCAYLCRQILGTSTPRIVTTLHGTDITLIGIDSSFREITRFGIQQSDAVTAVSEYLADATVSRFDPGVDIRVIPNFIDPERFSPRLRSAERRARFAEPGEVLIGHLSNFRPVKRIPDVIRTFHRVQKKIPARLLLMGEGVGVESAKYLAAELGLSERVLFLGPLTQVAEILAQLDLFLLPSEYESFGLAALEAMACGVPVVGTRTGGIPEVVEDGVSGLLCEVGDYPCMAARAIELLEHPSVAAAMGERARAEAVERYPQERVVERYEALYGEVLAGPAGRPSTVDRRE
jgi:N-acetyl-alpha-D-glucosaminyl L-malate synthase BshA